MAMSANKMVSKVATGEFKPNAEKCIPMGSERDFLAPLPVEKLPMVGAQTASFLQDMGVRTVATLREMPVKLLVHAFGKNGLALWNKAQGIDPSPVVPHTEQKSISTETTFSQDTTDVAQLRSVLVSMVERTAFQLRKQGKLASCVTVKIRYASFDTETRQAQVAYTASDDHLMRVVLELFGKLWNRRLLIRLVGVRLSGLVHGSPQVSLFEDTGARLDLYAAMDRIRDRHGEEKIVRATTLNTNRRVRMETSRFNSDMK
jgi:DNA polymerase-4